MAQKIVFKIMTMNDEKTKKKAMQAVADVYGVNSIEANLNEQLLTITGETDTIAIAKKLKKIGKTEVVSVGPDKEEEKEEEEEEEKEENKDEKK